jgi:hypothetical protein
MPKRAGVRLFASRDSVLDRRTAIPRTPRTVCPGQHLLAANGTAHTVVWWSPEPAVLRLDAQAPFGLRRDDLIVKDVPPTVLRRNSIHTHGVASARERNRLSLAARHRPSGFSTATEAGRCRLRARRCGTPRSVMSTSAMANERPGGNRFGSLVHALLADVPLMPIRSVLGQLAVAHGRLLAAFVRRGGGGRPRWSDSLSIIRC